LTSILSAISGQFSKNLILGTFLPVVLFVVLSLIFIVPLFPSDWPLLKPIMGLGTEGKVIVVSFIAIVIAGLLFNLNISILRLYEGYPWLESWIGRWLVKRQEQQFVMARSQRLGLRTLTRELRKDKKDAKLVSKLSARLSQVGRQMNNEFPSRPTLLLPTRLGNVIRSFEEYPERQYSIGAITLWPRLIAKIDKEYAVIMDDSKTSFDFMLNLSLLSAITGLVIIVGGLARFPPSNLFSVAGSMSPRWTIAIWVVTLCGFFLLSYVAYLGAISAAGAWGAKVKSAFDLYRNELLKQLGYDRLPPTLKEERDLWDAISLQMIYGDAPWGHDPLAEYKLLSTFARSRQPYVELETARGITVPEADGTIQVTVQVTNVDRAKRKGQEIIVTDTLPDGFEFEWNSPLVNSQRAPVTGANPYRFEIGDLAWSEKRILTYRAIQRKK
jgi:uncharacterized repeat protein (TIGR01451 family)